MNMETTIEKPKDVTKATDGTLLSPPNCSAGRAGIQFRAPDWRNKWEWLIHPIAAVLILPILVVGYFAAGIYVWGWNVRNSSSIHSSWRPYGPWELESYDSANDGGDS